MFITLAVIIFASVSSAVDSDFQKAKHRAKRWEGNSDMNNGDMSNMFRGTAGVDYPDLKTIPNTNFLCSEQEYEGGLYADVETRCQVYHVCHEGRKESFLCGIGTVFNQQILACDYWYSTECETAPSFYYVNSQISNSGPSYNPGLSGDANNNNQGIRPQSYNNNGQYQSQQGIGSQSYNPSSNRQPQSLTSGSNPGFDNGNYTPNNRQTQDFSGGGDKQGNDKSCCCMKNFYQAPWNFPATSNQRK